MVFCASFRALCSLGSARDARPCRPAAGLDRSLAFAVGTAVPGCRALGAELLLSRVSIVPVLGGLAALFLGWGFLRPPLSVALLITDDSAARFGLQPNYVPATNFRLGGGCQPTSLLGVPVLRKAT